MQAFTQHMGVAAPIIVNNVDTDQIIPSREMKRVSKSGLGDGLFAGWRYNYEGMNKVSLRQSFVLNQPQYFAASIILGGKNWGCGSSREHAVWALRDHGIRVIIAESFGRIFYRNCARNGLLAIELPAEQVELLAEHTAESPQSSRLLVDLVKGEIHGPRGDIFKFSTPESDRNMLLNGLDYIEYTMQFEDAIDAFAKRDYVARPWAKL
ncbi:MAG: 3-isopropylmalate dehydratase small subunit [Gammaproteobacteria bacterium]|nr:3-isopropylmalate dehydratase small subunit [Gammaproteobacteria bacterium]